MTRFLSILLLGLIFVGCGNGPLGSMPGHETDLVVLADGPVLLDESPVVFAGDRPMRVLGKRAAVCLVLRDGVSLEDSDSEALFNGLLHDAQVSISVKLSSGEIHKLSEPMPRWSRSGVIMKSGELSGCAMDCCEDTFSKGSEVSEVTIESSKPLNVKGIFWESRTDIGVKP